MLKQLCTYLCLYSLHTAVVITDLISHRGFPGWNVYRRHSGGVVCVCVYPARFVVGGAGRQLGSRALTIKHVVYWQQSNQRRYNPGALRWHCTNGSWCQHKAYSHSPSSGHVILSYYLGKHALLKDLWQEADTSLAWLPVGGGCHGGRSSHNCNLTPAFSLSSFLFISRAHYRERDL